MKSGDTIKIIADQEYEGVLMANSTETHTVLKLDSGYNISISNKKIKDKKLVKKAEDLKQKGKEIKPKKGLKKIVVLHTGGTIASKVEYKTGGVTAQFSASDLIEMVPELKGIANIEADLVANMMSEDMHFAEHKKIAKVILKHKDADGIIIGHGTDTLGYTAASLSFMFEKINIPVLIVGSQRSSDRGSSDAAMNLICAAEFIVNSEYTGIATCLHYDQNDDKCAIIAGTKSRKLHTSKREAFKAVNDTPIALVDYTNRSIEMLKDIQIEKDIVLKDKMSDDVGLLKSHPNMKPEVFEFFTKNYKAFVIEGTGLGHAPTNTKENEKNYEVLKKYIKNGGIVAMTSQCVYGRVSPTVYTNLRRLANIGVVYCEDTLPETAFVKLSWLLANNPKNAKDLMSENIRGEITKRSLGN